MLRLELIQDDITRQNADAIVNAANSSLMGGGGVDGAIHRAAGSGLLAECSTLGGCPTGEAKVTRGYNLLAKFVIHTVGPVWRGGHNNEEEQLANCYKNSLLIADNLKVNSIAFPNISTGVYGYPKHAAAEIAIQTVSSFHTKNDNLAVVFFVVYDDENYEIYEKMLSDNKKG